MKTDFYKKTEKDFKVLPNLENYQKTYDSFNWEHVKNELTWFDGKINAAYNAADRHTQTSRRNKMALVWVGEDGTEKKYTFEELTQNSNKMANLLTNFDVVEGDRVFIFLPRIPQTYFAFLGTLKIGAIAGTLFSAFQEQALEDRLGDSSAKVVITNTELLPRLEKIKKKLPNLKHILVVDTESFIKSFENTSDDYKTKQLDPASPSFMLYTSGTTGKPKGVVHTHKVVLQEYLTSKWVLDIQDSDVYWCTADHGWVTGIAYGILGIWAAGATSVVYAGRFDPQRWYEILEKYKVTVWYTAPTAIRMLMAGGTELVKQHDLSQLRHMCSVGEPLNPEAIKWGLKAFGMPFHDTWWQTETGAMCIVNYRCLDIKIGSMGKPFPGVKAAIVDDNGKEVKPGTEGNIALKPGWPSMMQSIWQREEKYKSYFIHGWYVAGDRGMMDTDGYFWFIGRADDVIKTSGERVGPFEVESALVEYPGVVEAGVIGKPDPVRGEIIKAFVVIAPEMQQKLKTKKAEEDFKMELSMHVKKHLAGHAYPREIEFIDKLPKTRSGKIMRRILKAKELGLPIGDTSTLEEY